MLVWWCECHGKILWEVSMSWMMSLGSEVSSRHQLARNLEPQSYILGNAIFLFFSFISVALKRTIQFGRYPFPLSCWKIPSIISMVIENGSPKDIHIKSLNLWMLSILICKWIIEDMIKLKFLRCNPVLNQLSL